jgi:hypothetical protein
VVRQFFTDGIAAAYDLIHSCTNGLVQLGARAGIARFLDDGRICRSNAATERAVRGIAIGRRDWTSAGSDAGGQGAAGLHADRDLR